MGTLSHDAARALLDAAPCGRLLVRAQGKALLIETIDRAAQDLLAIDGPAEREDRDQVDLVSCVGESDVGPLTAALASHQPVSLPVLEARDRWVELRFNPLPDERYAVSVVDVTTLQEQRRHDGVRREYLARLSDLALMFAFTNTLEVSSIIEVAASAARRMASAERATYYDVEEFTEERVLARPVYESRSMRMSLPDQKAPVIDLSRDDIDLIDELSAGTIVRSFDALPPLLSGALFERGSRGVVMLPVFRTDNIRGLILIEVVREGRTWLLEEVELLQAAMALFGSALDRVLARLELERSEAFSGSVVSAIADGIVVVDGAGQITMANPSAREVLAPFIGTFAAEAEELGSADALIDSAVDSDGTRLVRAVHPIERALHDGQAVHNITIGLQPPPGGTGDNSDSGDDILWLQMSAQPAPEAANGGVVVCFSNVTQRRRYEAELLLTRDAALDASRLKGAFLANMSHEIRTPMNGVIGTSSLLLASGLTGRQHEYALTLKSAAESLLTILDDVLDLSKIEAGRIEIEKVPFDPVEVVDNVVELLGPTATAKDLKLGVHVDPALPAKLSGDPHRLRQVLNNLVGNAIKFTDIGFVRVILSGLEDGGQSWLNLEVQDSGIGLSTTENIFDRFTQADVSTTRRFGGTGLGLSICKQLVELMGGSIQVESVLGRGSRFSFRIPAAVVAGREALFEPGLAGLSILVAADDDELCRLVRTHLTRWGAEPVTPLSLRGLPPPTFCAAAIVEAGSASEAAAREEFPTIFADAMPVVHLAAPGSRVESGHVRWPPSARDMQRTLLAALLGPEQAASEPFSGPDTLPVEQIQVLVVEDQAVNQLVARSMLELLGCDVTMANHGAEAFSLASEQSYDIIFMDCQMPVMDGFEACRRIRAAEGEGEHTPIVAVSASAMGSERTACEDAGMDGFLAKPVRLEDFRKALSTWVAKESSTELISAPSEAPVLDADIPLLDDETLGRLRSVDLGRHGADLVGELADLFIVEGEARLQALATALQEKDAKALRVHAHSLKGSASTLGALRLSSACRDLESRIGDQEGEALHDVEDLTAKLSALRELYSVTRVALEAVR